MLKDTLGLTDLAQVSSAGQRQGKATWHFAFTRMLGDCPSDGCCASFKKEVTPLASNSLPHDIRCIPKLTMTAFRFISPKS